MGATMLHRLLLACLLLLASPAWAGYSPGFDLGPQQTGVSGLALTTSPVVSLRSNGYAALTLYIQLTRSAATAVNIACTAGPTSAIQAPLGVATVANTGSISMAAASWTYPVSASGTLRLIIAPVNDNYINCTLTGASATSSDLVTVYARAGGTP